MYCKSLPKKPSRAALTSCRVVIGGASGTGAEGEPSASVLAFLVAPAYVCVNNTHRVFDIITCSSMLAEIRGWNITGRERKWRMDRTRSKK